MNLTDYRASAAEQERTADLLRLMPTTGCHALDIGARDGHFSVLMAERFAAVTALDLTRPSIAHAKVHCIEGNAATMPFADASFDFVFCAEVLEHVPPNILPDVCREIERVCSDRILVGVPYKQDIRVGRTTCRSCGQPNPPWGHVNSFDERRLSSLFSQSKLETLSFVGENSSRTNQISTVLMDFAGNPYGTYEQEEGCIHCGKRLLPPAERSLAQKIATRLAFWSRGVTNLVSGSHGNWIHAAFRKVNSG